MYWLLLCGIFSFSVLPEFEQEIDLAIATLPDGTLSVRGSAEIPPLPENGRWQETEPRSTDRFFCRHFMFVAPGQPPALEVFVTADRNHEPSDGVLEASLVRGFLSTFSKGIGFSYSAPEFASTMIGHERVESCRVELNNGRRSIWLYAYIFRRSPSLVFLAIRPRGDEGPGIEDFLAKVSFK